MKRNVTLDLFKLAAAFAVICIHYMFSGAVGISVKAVARFAVPFFFAVSGFFAWKQRPEKLMKRARGIAKLYLASFVLYFLYGAFREILLGKASSVADYVMKYVQPKTILNFLIHNTTISAVHLWFLPALIYCYLLMCLCIKVKVPEKVLTTAAVVLLAIQLITGEGLSILQVQFDADLPNFLFLGFPFFLLGRTLSRIQEERRPDFRKCSGWLILLLLFAGIAGSVLSVLVWGGHLIYAGSVMIVSALLLAALKYRERAYAPCLVALAELSTHIYVFHVAVGGTLETIAAKVLHCSESPVWINAKPFIVLILSILIGAIFSHLYAAAVKAIRAHRATPAAR